MSGLDGFHLLDGLKRALAHDDPVARPGQYIPPTDCGLRRVASDPERLGRRAGRIVPGGVQRLSSAAGEHDRLTDYSRLTQRPSSAVGRQIDSVPNEAVRAYEALRGAVQGRHGGLRQTLQTLRQLSYDITEDGMRWVASGAETRELERVLKDGLTERRYGSGSAPNIDGVDLMPALRQKLTSMSKDDLDDLSWMDE